MKGNEMKTVYVACEYDNGITDEWFLETREKAEAFIDERGRRLNPEIYWIHYYVEERELTPEIAAIMAA